jgi:hypothetical protein
MATGVGTGGTTNTTRLTAFQFYCKNDTSGVNPGANQFAADVGTVNNLILDDKTYLFPVPTGQGGTGVTAPATLVGQGTAGLLSGGLSTSGILTVPNRGTLKVFPGDVIMIDPNSGWPILVSRTSVLISGTFWATSVAVT